MNLQVEPPEKNKRKKKKKTKNSSPPQPSSPSFSLLPDDIAVNCLARISRSHYPNLSIVSKSFRSLVSSTELYAARSHLGSTEQCLYVCLSDKSYQFPQWFTLWTNPNRNLPRKKKKTIGQLLVPIPPSDFPSESESTVVVGSEIYVIGGPIDGAPSSAVRILDCRSHTWRDAPSMIVPRKHALACVYEGRIYVMGSCKGLEEESSSWAEVFDTKTQTWQSLPDPGPEIRNCFLHRIAEIEGKIHLWNSSIKTYAYEPIQDKWECSEGMIENFPRSECVMENVWYIYRVRLCQWAVKDGSWKNVKGLDSLREIYRRNGGSSGNTTKFVSCGGKLLLIWEGYMKHNPNNRKKIWCAEIVVEKVDEDEVWGNVEWVGVVQSVPTSCQLLHCLVVSV
ncbi:hypothetical protein EUTSA_v10025408mg [Eutrema salsugineum]|uniref:F-box domain-containing protein n=2 Tax=Eutrema salsugineum TaxID=72664 RepID=V4P723_EUTSA|nr:hypothetical protein EUTSA_v10025408mg [Eutrema salsugineum]